MVGDTFLSISALQHYAFCPRQFALIHVEQAWAENHFTAEGRILHERVDSGEAEQRGKIRRERSVLLVSHQHQLKGKMDLLEIETLGDQAPHYFPVEYKRGKPKVEAWDRVQVCAQALCIEEMRKINVAEGAIWYWEVRRRERVIIDDTLRTTTLAVIKGAHDLLAAGKTPLPLVDQSRCRACSLVDMCQPHTFKRDHSRKYVADLFTNEPILKEAAHDTEM